MSRDIRCMRIITSLLVVPVCGAAMLWGLSAMQFALARDFRSPNSGQTVERWVGTPGLTIEAIKSSLDRKHASDPIARATELAALLTLDPMSAEAWFSIADAWFVIGRPAADVDAALNMSIVTGANEGQIMWQRGMLGLIRWNQLSPAAQQRVAVDLAGAVQDNVPDGRSTQLAKRVVQQESPESRSEIAHALTIEGLSQTELAAFGL